VNLGVCHFAALQQSVLSAVIASCPAARVSPRRATAR